MILLALVCALAGPRCGDHHDLPLWERESRGHARGPNRSPRRVAWAREIPARVRCKQASAIARMREIPATILIRGTGPLDHADHRFARPDPRRRAIEGAWWCSHRRRAPQARAASQADLRTRVRAAVTPPGREPLDGEDETGVLPSNRSTRGGRRRILARAGAAVKIRNAGRGAAWCSRDCCRRSDRGRPRARRECWRHARARTRTRLSSSDPESSPERSEIGYRRRAGGVGPTDGRRGDPQGRARRSREAGPPARLGARRASGVIRSRRAQHGGTGARCVATRGVSPSASRSRDATEEVRLVDRLSGVGRRGDRARHGPCSTTAASESTLGAAKIERSSTWGRLLTESGNHRGQGDLGRNHCRNRPGSSPVALTPIEPPLRAPPRASGEKNDPARARASLRTGEPNRAAAPAAPSPRVPVPPPPAAVSSRARRRPSTYADRSPVRKNSGSARALRPVRERCQARECGDVELGDCRLRVKTAAGLPRGISSKRSGESSPL